MTNTERYSIKGVILRNDRAGTDDPEILLAALDELPERLRHDEAYKLLFLHKDFMAGLLSGLVRADWVGDVDLESLEEARTERVGKKLKKRLNDVAWRARLKSGEGWIDIYLVLELQASVDDEMALRTLIYSGAGYEGQIGKGTKVGKDLFVPMAFVVLHTGPRPWTAKRDMIDLIQPVPASMRHLLPRVSYELVEERLAPEPGQAEAGNPAEAVLAIGRSKTSADMLRAIREALQTLSGRPDLLKLVVAWLDRYYLKRRFPKREFERRQTMEKLHDMLEEELEDFDEITRREALAEARRQVRKEVRAEFLNDVRENTAQLVRERFGARAAAQAEASLASVTRLKSLMDANKWVIASESESALLARLATI